jgi:hypothetical protein
MHGSTVVIRPPDGDMAVYLDSLAKVAGMVGATTGSPMRFGPGHGRVIDSPLEVLAALEAHRLDREARVAAALADARRGTVDDLLGRVYDDVTEAQLPVARFSLWAHLRKLAAEGRAEVVVAAGAAGAARTADDPDGQLSATWVATGTTAP